MKGYYINLEHRLDRKFHFEHNIKKLPLFKEIKRFSAIETNPGFIGCGKSHIEVLKKLENEEGDAFLVCEDDLQIINNKAYDTFVANFKKISDSKQWDLITLTPVLPAPSRMQSKEMFKYGFKRLETAQTTTAYVIKKTFIKTLLDNFQYATEKLSEGSAKTGVEKVAHYHRFAIDQYWKRLFKTHNVYAFNLIYASQLPGYSDIEKKYMTIKTQYLRGDILNSD